MPSNGRKLRRISHARLLVAHVLREVENAGNVGEDLERAKVLIQGAQVLGRLINDVEASRRFEELEAEIARLKAGKLAVVK